MHYNNITKLKVFTLLFLFFPLYAVVDKPLLSLGGGYWDARRQPSGGLIQVEYKWARKYWNVFRPQAELIVPTLNSVFLGVGIGVEMWAGPVVISPNFSPGIYIKGSGTDLGCPLEFRSSMDIAYQLKNGSRIGTQFYHISNASIGKHNPGANAVTLFFAFPL